MIMEGAYTTLRLSGGEQQAKLRTNPCRSPRISKADMFWRCLMKHEGLTIIKNPTLTTCGTCCMCAATFTLDGPSVLGRSCLATGAAVGWTVTKDRTPDRRREKTSDEESSKLKLHCPLSSSSEHRSLLVKTFPDYMSLYHTVVGQKLERYTFAGAQILIDENLQLSIRFNQTSLWKMRC